MEVVFYVGTDVWAGVLIEDVDLPGTGLWFEALIGDLALTEILI